MNGIQSTTVQIKSSEGHEQKWCLVHDGQKVLAMVEPGTKVGAPSTSTMVVGTKAEVDAEVARLRLTPAPSRVIVPKGRRTSPSVESAPRVIAAEEQ